MSLMGPVPGSLRLVENMLCLPKNTGTVWRHCVFDLGWVSPAHVDAAAPAKGCAMAQRQLSHCHTKKGQGATTTPPPDTTGWVLCQTPAALAWSACHSVGHTCPDRASTSGICLGPPRCFGASTACSSSCRLQLGIQRLIINGCCPAALQP
jgi:hypothetical protein